MAKKKDKGKEFENKVAELYRIMGYEVKQNVGILGHQIDIMLTFKQPGGIVTKTAIECKYVEKGNLRKNNVIENINALIDLRNNKEAHNFIVITTNGFAKDVWDSARANDIQLLTFRDLQRQILDFNPYLQTLIYDFEKDPEKIKDYYVELNADHEEFPKVVSKRKEKFREKIKKLYSPIDDFTSTWLDDNTQNHLSILGEYGTGKTTFARKYAYDLAKQYLESEGKQNLRIPILISLREFAKTMDIESLITNQLVNKCGIQNANYNIFKKMNEEGLFLLIFDGFDEMAQRVDFDTTYSNFETIAQLVNPNSKVILTCRTEYFRTHQRETEILRDIERRKNYDILYLRELEDKQIQEYLQKRLPGTDDQGNDWRYYWDKINEIFDLRDLAKRPVLLNLIVKYLPGLIATGGKINASSLYSYCLKEELKRIIKSRNVIIRSEDRLKLMKLLANWMYLNNQLELHYKKIPEVLKIKDHFDARLSQEIEWYLHDFLTTSCLNRDPEGNYRFSHKSFIDFLMSQLYIDEINGDKPVNFGKNQISAEIYNFLKENEIPPKNLFKWIQESREKKGEEFKFLASNAISLLNYKSQDLSGKDFSNLNLENVNLYGTNLQRSIFANSNLTDATLHSCDLSDANFSGAILKNANLNNTILKNANFTKAVLKGTSFGEIKHVHSIAWSQNKKYIAFGGEDYNINVWDIKKWIPIVSLRGHKASINCISFSPDNNYLASSSDDSTIIIWDIKTWKIKKTLYGHYGGVSSICFSTNDKLFVSFEYSGKIILWDVKTWKKLRVLRENNHRIISSSFKNNIIFSHDNKYIIYILEGLEEKKENVGLEKKIRDRQIGVWDLDISKEILIPNFKADGLVAASPDGAFFACSDKDYNITIFDMNSFTQIKKLREYKNRVEYFTFCYNGKLLVSADWDYHLKIWYVPNWKEILTLKAHKDLIWALSSSADGKFVASSSREGTIKIWDMSLFISGKWDQKKDNNPNWLQKSGLKVPEGLRPNPNFGQCIHTIKMQINCEDAIFIGAIDLDRLVRSDNTLQDFFEERKAIAKLYSKSELQKLKKRLGWKELSLEKICENRGLKKTGTKAELINRILKHQQAFCKKYGIKPPK